MIFVRNDHGSHNPKEAMEIDDFALGLRLLVAAVEEIDGSFSLLIVFRTASVPLAHDHERAGRSRSGRA